MFSYDDTYIFYLSAYLCLFIGGFIFGLVVYYNCKDTNKILISSNNKEIINIIKTMKNDLIINIDKYSFIEINDIINIIIDIYIKNKCKYSENDDIILFMENKRKSIINDVKLKLLINYKNDLINKIIMEKNILNTKLTINDLKNIKDSIEEHKKELNNLFELVNEFNTIDIKLIKINFFYLLFFIRYIN